MAIVDEIGAGIIGGVDTHLDSHAVAALDAIGGLLGVEHFDAGRAGEEKLIAWLQGLGPIERVGVMKWQCRHGFRMTERDRKLSELAFLDGGSDRGRAPVWRLSTAPMTGPKVVRALNAYMPCSAVYDWSGGLIWLEVPATADAGATDVRRVLASHGGHATLMRADAAVRAGIDVFQPLLPGLQSLSRGLKAAFDPVGVLNPGRMYADM